MDRLTQKFISHVEVLQNQLENLLSKDWGPQDQREPHAPFEVQTDLTQLEALGWALPAHEPQRSELLFEKMAAFFEVGFCFHLGSMGQPGWINWKLRSAFSQGHFAPLLPDDNKRLISLPQMGLSEIRKVPADFLLRELKLKNIFEVEKLSAMVIRPSDERLWILFSNLPDVFLKPHMTQIHEACLMILADFAHDKGPR